MADRRYITGKYEEYYNSLQGDGAATKASNFITEVNSMVTEYSNISQLMTYWSGEAKDSMSQGALSSIMEEFKTTQENIQGTLYPCCTCIDYLSKALDEMKKKEDEMLQNENELESLKNNKPADTVPCVHTARDADGNATGKQHPGGDPNTEALNKWQSEVTAKEEVIANLEKELNELKEKTDEAIKTIEDLESQLKDFTNYMNMTGTILGIEDSNQFSKYTLEERIQCLQGIIDNYQLIYDSLNKILQAKYKDKGLTFSAEDFKNIDIIFDVFDLYWMSGVNQKDMIQTKEGSSIFLDVEKLTKVLGFCTETNALTCIQNYLNGSSWKDSGLEDLMNTYSKNVLKINVYDENQLKQRLKEKYNVDEKDAKSFLKNAFTAFDKDGSYSKLKESFGEYQQLASTMSVIKEKIKNLQTAQKLLPYEMEMDNPDFEEYMKKDYSDYFGIDKEKLSIMSQQEIALYDYLLHNKSKQEADSYLSAMQPAFNQRIGAKRAADYIESVRAEGFDFGDLVNTGLTGFWDGVRGFGQGIERLFTGWSLEEGDKSILDYEQMYKSIYMQQLMNDPSFLDLKDNEKYQGWNDLNAWYNTSSSIGNMAIPSIIGMIPGGQPLSSVLFAASAAGNSFAEAKIEGKTTAQAFAYGVFNGVTEAATEWMFGYIPGLSAESKGFLGNLFSEGFEEFVQEYMDVGARALILGDEEAGAAIKNLGGIFTGDFDTVGAVERLNTGIESFKYGAITTGIMQPGSAALSFAATGATKLSNASKFNVDVTVDGKPVTIDINGGNDITYINQKTGKTETVKFGSFGEFKNAVEARSDITKANKVINETIEKVNNGESLTLRDKVKLNNAVGNLSVDELSSLKSAYSENDQKIIKQATDGIPKLSKQTREQFELADKFEQVSSATDSLSNVEFSKDELTSEVTRDGRTLGEYIADTKSSAIDTETRRNIEAVSKKQMNEIDSRIEENAKRAEKQAKKIEKKMIKEAKKSLSSTETEVRESGSSTSQTMDSRVSETRQNSQTQEQTRQNTDTISRESNQEVVQLSEQSPVVEQTRQSTDNVVIEPDQEVVQLTEQSPVLEQVRQSTDTTTRTTNQETSQVVEQSPVLEQVKQSTDTTTRTTNQETSQVVEQSPVLEQIRQSTDTTTRSTSQETAQVSQENQEAYQAAPVMQQVIGQSMLEQMIENETSSNEENISHEISQASAASLAATAAMGLTGMFDSKTDTSVETKDSSIDVTPRSATTTQTDRRVTIEETSKNENKQTTTFQEPSSTLESWDFDDASDNFFDDDFYDTKSDTKTKPVQENGIISNYNRNDFIKYVKSDNTGAIVELFNSDTILEQIETNGISKIDIINDIVYNSNYINELFENEKFVNLFLETANNWKFNFEFLNNETCNIIIEQAIKQNADSTTIAKVFNTFNENYILDSLDNWNYSNEVLYDLLNNSSAQVVNKIINNFDIDLANEKINIANLFSFAKASNLSNQELNENARRENIITIPVDKITPELANRIWSEYELDTIRNIISDASYSTDTSLLNKIIKSKELTLIKETQNVIELCNKLDSLDKNSNEYFDLYEEIYNSLKNSKNSKYSYYMNDGRITTKLENNISYLVIDYLFEDNFNNVVIDINELVNFVKNGHMEISPSIMSFYEKIININNINVDEKISLLSEFKDVNMSEQLYDDIKKAKSIMNTDIKEKSLSKDSIQEFKNEELSEKYGIPVFTPNDSEFYAIVKTDTGYFTGDLLPTGHSFSLVSDRNTTVFGDVKEATTFIYDSSTLNPDQIVHTFPADSYTMYRPFYFSDSSTDRINKLMTAQELVESTKGYNELLILEQGKKQTDIDSSAPALGKMALYCVDEITEHDVEVAKKEGLGIILVQSSSAVQNDFDYLNNNYDSKSSNRIQQELKQAETDTQTKTQTNTETTFEDKKSSTRAESTSQSISANSIIEILKNQGLSIEQDQNGDYIIQTDFDTVVLSKDTIAQHLENLSLFDEEYQQKYLDIITKNGAYSLIISEVPKISTDGNDNVFYTFCGETFVVENEHYIPSIKNMEQQRIIAEKNNELLHSEEYNKAKELYPDYDVRVENGNYVFYYGSPKSAIEIESGNLINELEQTKQATIEYRYGDVDLISSWKVNDDSSYTIKTVYGETINYPKNFFENVSVETIAKIYEVFKSNDFNNIRRYFGDIISNYEIDQTGSNITVITKLGNEFTIDLNSITDYDFINKMISHKYEQNATRNADGSYTVSNEFGDTIIVSEEDFKSGYYLQEIVELTEEHKGLLVDDWIQTNIENLEQSMTESQKKELQSQVQRIADKIGSTYEDTKRALDKALANAIEESEFGQRISGNNLLSILDSYIKNQHETVSSDGANNPVHRKNVENELSKLPQTIDSEDSPVYGMAMPKFNSADSKSIDFYKNGLGIEYGDGEVVIIYDKGKIITKTTASIGDSLNYSSTHSQGLISVTSASNPTFTGAYLDFVYNFNSLDDIRKANFYDLLGTSKDQYIELQIQGRYSHDVNNIKQVVFTKTPSIELIQKLASLEIPFKFVTIDANTFVSLYNESDILLNKTLSTLDSNQVMDLNNQINELLGYETVSDDVKLTLRALRVSVKALNLVESNDLLLETIQTLDEKKLNNLKGRIQDLVEKKVISQQKADEVINIINNKSNTISINSNNEVEQRGSLDSDRMMDSSLIESKIDNKVTEAAQQDSDTITINYNGETQVVSKKEVVKELEEYAKSTGIEELIQSIADIKGEEYSLYKQMYLESFMESDSDIRLDIISGFVQSAIKNGDISLINQLREELSTGEINGIKTILSPNMSMLFDNYGINGFDVDTVESMIKTKTVESLFKEISESSTNPTLYEHYKNQAILLCESDSKEKSKIIASIASTLIQKGDIKLLEQLKENIQIQELIDIRTQLEIIDSDAARVFANINIEKDFDHLLFNAGLRTSVGSTSIKYENGIYTSEAYGQTLDITKAVNMHIENIRNMDMETTNRYMEMIVENRSLLFGQYSEGGRTSNVTYNLKTPVEKLINNIDLSFFNDPNYDVLHGEIGITYKTKDGSYIILKEYATTIAVPISTIEKHVEALSKFDGDIKEKYNSIFNKLITDKALYEGRTLLSDALNTHIENSLKMEEKHLGTYFDFISERLDVDQSFRVDDLVEILRSIDVSFFEDNNYETLRNNFDVDYKTLNKTYVLQDMSSLPTVVVDKHVEIYNSLDSSKQSTYIASYSNWLNEDFKKMSRDYEWVLYVSPKSESGMNLINSYLNTIKKQFVFTISDGAVEVSNEIKNITNPFFASILNGMQERINAFDFTDSRIQTIMDTVNNLSIEVDTKKTIARFLGYKIDELNQKLIDDAINLTQSVIQSNSLEMKNFTNSILIEAFKVENPYEAIAKIKNIFEKNNLPVVGKVYRCFEVLHPGFKGFNFSSTTISPVLENSGNLRRRTIVFTDLIRSTFGSNNRSVNNYLNNIEFGQTVFEQIKNGTFNQDSLSIEEQNELITFRNHLATMYENTLVGKNEDTSFVRSENIADDILKLAQKLSPNGTLDFNLGDRLVDMFCGFADIKTVDQAKGYIKTKIETAEQRNIEASKKTMTIEEGDLVKGIGGIKYLGDILQNGSVSKEYLGASADSDATPLDTDLSRIEKTGKTVKESISSTAASSYGPIFFVLKNDSRFDVTRTKDGVVDVPKTSSKLELFYTGVLGDGHYGIRTGFASSEIDYIVSENYDPRIGLEIAKNGFYIPVADMDGNIVFTYDDYISLRNKMSGLSYYGDGTYNLSDHLTSERVMDTQTRVVESLGHTSETVTSISSQIKGVLLSSGIDSVFDGYNSDLSSNGAEVYSTGSTSRGTCVPGDSDFDYLVKVDRETYFNKEKLAELKSKFMEQMGLKEGPGGKVVGEIVNENGEVFDVEISFCPRTDRVEFSTDMALAEKLNAIKEQNRAHYEEVLANIVTAKEVLKEANAYKSQKSGTNEGGLGGIGIENWILQNGGSFHDAAVSFLEVADKCESFEEFKEKYHVFDLGENHYSDKVGTYPHEDFVFEVDSSGAPLKMTSEGYGKMKQALRTYLENEKLVASTSVETKQDKVSFYDEKGRVDSNLITEDNIEDVSKVLVSKEVKSFADIVEIKEASEKISSLTDTENVELTTELDNKIKKEIKKYLYTKEELSNMSFKELSIVLEYGMSLDSRDAYTDLLMHDESFRQKIIDSIRENPDIEIFNKDDFYSFFDKEIPANYFLLKDKVRIDSLAIFNNTQVEVPQEVFDDYVKSNGNTIKEVINYRKVLPKVKSLVESNPDTRFTIDFSMNGKIDTTTIGYLLLNNLKMDVELQFKDGAMLSLNSEDFRHVVYQLCDKIIDFAKEEHSKKEYTLADLIISEDNKINLANLHTNSNIMDTIISTVANNPDAHYSIDVESIKEFSGIPMNYANLSISYNNNGVMSSMSCNEFYDMMDRIYDMGLSNGFDKLIPKLVEMNNENSIYSHLLQNRIIANIVDSSDISTLLKNFDIFENNKEAQAIISEKMSSMTRAQLKEFYKTISRDDYLKIFKCLAQTSYCLNSQIYTIDVNAYGPNQFTFVNSLSSLSNSQEIYKSLFEYMKTVDVDNWLGGKIIEGLPIKDVIENYDVFSKYDNFNRGVREHLINSIINYEGDVPLEIIEKEAFEIIDFDKYVFSNNNRLSEVGRERILQVINSHENVLVDFTGSFDKYCLIDGIENENVSVKMGEDTVVKVSEIKREITELIDLSNKVDSSESLEKVIDQIEYLGEKYGYYYSGVSEVLNKEEYSQYVDGMSDGYLEKMMNCDIQKRSIMNLALNGNREDLISLVLSEKGLSLKEDIVLEALKEQGEIKSTKIGDIETERIRYTTKIDASILTDEAIKRINEYIRSNPDITIALDFENTNNLTSEMISKLDDNVLIKIEGGYDTDMVFNKYFADSHPMYLASEFLSNVFTKSESYAIISKMEEIESRIDESWTEKEKAIYLYEKLRDFITYDTYTCDLEDQAVESKNITVDSFYTKDIRSLRGLITGKAVCAGYSVIYQEMLTRQGIKAYYEDGEAFKEHGIIRGGGHAWNVVNLDGKYYVCDLTWGNDYEFIESYEEFAICHKFDLETSCVPEDVYHKISSMSSEEVDSIREKVLPVSKGQFDDKLAELFKSLTEGRDLHEIDMGEEFNNLPSIDDSRLQPANARFDEKTSTERLTRQSGETLINRYMNTKMDDHSDYSLKELLSIHKDVNRLFKEMLDMAPDVDSQMVLADILFNGGYGDYGFASGLTPKNNPSIDAYRRLSMAALYLTSPDTFNKLASNNVNVFHGTSSANLKDIIENGLMSGSKQEQSGRDVKTGEWSIIGGVGGQQRDFISFADVFDIAYGYSSLAKGDNFEVIVGTTSENIKDLKRYTIQSDVSEIGIAEHMPADRITTLIVPKDKVSLVEEMVKGKDIQVLSLDGYSYDSTGFYFNEGFIEVIDESIANLKNKVNSKYNINQNTDTDTRKSIFSKGKEFIQKVFNKENSSKKTESNSKLEDSYENPVVGNTLLRSAKGGKNEIMRSFTNLAERNNADIFKTRWFISSDGYRSKLQLLASFDSNTGERKYVYSIQTDMGRFVASKTFSTKYDMMNVFNNQMSFEQVRDYLNNKNIISTINSIEVKSKTGDLLVMEDGKKILAGVKLNQYAIINRNTGAHYIVCTETDIINNVNGNNQRAVWLAENRLALKTKNFEGYIGELRITGEMMNNKKIIDSINNQTALIEKRRIDIRNAMINKSMQNASGILYNEIAKSPSLKIDGSELDIKKVYEINEFVKNRDSRFVIDLTNLLELNPNLLKQLDNRVIIHFDENFGDKFYKNIDLNSISVNQMLDSYYDIDTFRAKYDNLVTIRKNAEHFRAFNETFCIDPESKTMGLYATAFFHNQVRDGRIEAINIMDTLTKIKKLDPNFKIVVDDNGGGYYSKANNLIHFSLSKINENHYTTFFHEVGHCLFDKVCGEILPRKTQKMFDKAQRKFSKNTLLQQKLNEKFNYFDEKYSIKAEQMLSDEILKKGYSSISDYKSKLFENLNKNNEMVQELKDSLLEQQKEKIKSNPELEYTIRNYSAYDLAELLYENEIKKYKDSLCRTDDAYSLVSSMLDNLFFGNTKDLNGNNLPHGYGHSYNYFHNNGISQLTGHGTYNGDYLLAFHEVIADYLNCKFSPNKNAFNEIKEILGDNLINELETIYQKFINYDGSNVISNNSQNNYRGNNYSESTIKIENNNALSINYLDNNHTAMNSRIKSQSIFDKGKNIVRSIFNGNNNQSSIVNNKNIMDKFDGQTIDGYNYSILKIDQFFDQQTGTNKNTYLVVLDDNGKTISKAYVSSDNFFDDFTKQGIHAVFGSNSDSLSKNGLFDHFDKKNNVLKKNTIVINNQDGNMFIVENGITNLASVKLNQYTVYDTKTGSKYEIKTEMDIINDVIGNRLRSLWLSDKTLKNASKYNGYVGSISVDGTIRTNNSIVSAINNGTAYSINNKRVDIDNSLLEEKLFNAGNITYDMISNLKESGKISGRSIDLKSIQLINSVVSKYNQKHYVLEIDGLEDIKDPSILSKLDKKIIIHYDGFFGDDFYKDVDVNSVIKTNVLSSYYDINTFIKKYNNLMIVQKNMNSFVDFYKLYANDKSTGINTKYIMSFIYQQVIEGNHDTINVMKALTQIKQNDNSFKIVVNDDYVGGYYSSRDNLIHFSSSDIKNNHYTTFFHEVGHCLFDKVFKNITPNNIQSLFDKAQINISNNTKTIDNLTKLFTKFEDETKIDAEKEIAKELKFRGFNSKEEYINSVYNSLIKDKSLVFDIKERIKEMLGETYAKSFDVDSYSEKTLAQEFYRITIERPIFDQQRRINDCYVAVSDVINAIFLGNRETLSGQRLPGLYLHGSSYYHQYNYKNIFKTKIKTFSGDYYLAFDEIVANYFSSQFSTNKTVNVAYDILLGKDFVRELNKIYDTFINKYETQIINKGGEKRIITFTSKTNNSSDIDGSQITSSLENPRFEQSYSDSYIDNDAQDRIDNLIGIIGNEHKNNTKKNSTRYQYTLSPIENVKANPEEYIIPDCLDACKMLWEKGIDTVQCSNYDDDNRYIEISTRGLSDENKKIVYDLCNSQEDNGFTIGYLTHCPRIYVNDIGKSAAEKLCKLVNQLQFQDTNKYMTVEEYLDNYKREGMSINYSKIDKYGHAINHKDYNSARINATIEEALQANNEQGLYVPSEGRIYANQEELDHHLRYLKYKSNVE